MVDGRIPIDYSENSIFHVVRRRFEHARTHDMNDRFSNRDLVIIIFL